MEQKLVVQKTADVQIYENEWSFLRLTIAGHFQGERVGTPLLVSK